MSNKLRWGKWYWSDWSDDPALARCSHAAQSVWMRLMCIAAQGTPYGHVTINGKSPSIEDLGALMRPTIKPSRMARLIEELERRGVAARDACGCLVSRRMEADGQVGEARSTAAKKRWSDDSSPANWRQTESKRNPFGKPTDRLTPLKTHETDSGLHMQTSDFAYARISRNTESESPLSPPKGGRGRGGSNLRSPKFKNGFIALVAEELEEERRHAEAADPHPDRAAVVRIPRHAHSG